MRPASFTDIKFRPTSFDDCSAIVGWFANLAEAVLWGGPQVPEKVDAAWLAGELDSEDCVYRTA